MSQPLEFHKEMGSLEAHEGIMRKRLEEAQRELENVRNKPGISQIAIDKAEIHVREAQEALEKFMEENAAVK